jgi:phosphopantothenoylcysteine decarboxylase/phosphopantothenate--cysteine ligase
MFDVVMKHAENVDLIIKTAAVADYRLKEIASQKIKKNSEELEIQLVKNKDILLELGKRKTEHQFLVGFAAESQNIKEYGLSKLKKKNLDMIVINDISKEGIGFSSDQNEVLILETTQQNSPIQVPCDSKQNIARKILDVVSSNSKWKHFIK